MLGKYGHTCQWHDEHIFSEGPDNTTFSPRQLRVVPMRERERERERKSEKARERERERETERQTDRDRDTARDRKTD